jgi:2,4-dienoyl-CoA reductase-like NADH-dependent reductase (Old Yellow Enzyme family)
MHERFKYKNKEELLNKAKQLGLDLPFDDDISILLSPLTVESHVIPNRIVIQPMEGYDSTPDGSPSDLTIRRYLRYADGGSGLIWFEAVAVSHQGRSNPRQLWLHKGNPDHFKILNDEIRKHANANNCNPMLVVQLTQSGRYSKPDGKAEPLVPQLNPVLDKGMPYVLSDNELKVIQDQFIATARLALAAGFDAIDIKACHGYLIHELLFSKERKNSIYGGPDPSNRFRFLLETIDRIKADVPGIMLTVRLNIYDVYKNGFGIGKDEFTPDYSEPEMLVNELKQRGIRLLNLTMGSPYFNPHVTRPFDNPVPGVPLPEEHPLAGVVRMIEGTSVFQHKFPEIKIVGSAYSFLRQYAPNVGAAIIKNNGASLIGFGRNAFAYPSLANDLIKTGKADPQKVCITCSGCTRLIRSLYKGGCVIRDREIYGNELKKLLADGKN